MRSELVPGVRATGRGHEGTHRWGMGSLSGLGVAWVRLGHGGHLHLSDAQEGESTTRRGLSAAKSPALPGSWSRVSC